MRDDHGQSPLDRALEDVDDEDDLDLGLYLINHGCGGYEGKVELMCEACCWDRLDVVKELVELHKVDPKGECIYCSTMHHIVIHHLCCADVRNNTDGVYCTVWLVENSYTTVSSHSVRVCIFGLWVAVIEEYVIVWCQSYWIGLG